MTDDIVELLANQFNVQKASGATGLVHPRFSQYKSTGKFADKQNDRRVEAMKKQRRNRHELYDAFREAFAKETEANTSQNSCDSTNDGDTDKESVQRRRSGGSSRRQGGPARYKDQLMLSEWLVEIPEDLEADWVLIACPAGKRCLIVAQFGRTCAYSRTGHLLLELGTSPFPGGSRALQRNALTLLDAVYCEVQRRFYLLDVLCWNSVPLFDSDFDMRRFWLKTRFEEDSRPSNSGSMETDSAGSQYAVLVSGAYSFQLLTIYTCDRAQLQQIVATRHFEPPVELDGLLFLHKQAHYVAGVTPLACWLHAWMAVELFGLSHSLLHADYVAKVPLEFRSSFASLAPSASQITADTVIMDGDDGASQESTTSIAGLLHANAVSAKRNWEKKSQRLQQNDEEPDDAAT